MLQYVMRMCRNSSRAGFQLCAFVLQCGSYHIGKERAYLGAAKLLGWKVWCDANKRRVWCLSQYIHLLALLLPAAYGRRNFRLLLSDYVKIHQSSVSIMQSIAQFDKVARGS